jgi:cephalosporin-C deacetylase-like acetyl esterase
MQECDLIEQNLTIYAFEKSMRNKFSEYWGSIREILKEVNKLNIENK